MPVTVRRGREAGLVAPSLSTTGFPLQQWPLLGVGGGSSEETATRWGALNQPGPLSALPPILRPSQQATGAPTVFL